jgi:methionyl-tRNA synthetase
MKDRFYITTSIMYTNAQPHIGFVLELLQADALARYYRQAGKDVRFLTGTDEHGIKNAQAASAAGMEPQLFVDDISAQVRALTERLDISNTDFIRTTDRERHWPGVEKIWRKMAASGDLYKKKYEGYYCVGHEAFIKERELEDGRCPLHKTMAELVEEENWFFRLSKYRDDVKELIENGNIAIIPEFRRKEVLNLLDDAEDVSFSRSKEKLSWGIPVPDDPGQTIYVWADALTNYLSSLGYADDSEDYRDYWPADVHLVGKDIFRFHAMIWPAMLLSAGLEVPRAVYVHGFINVAGQKMSKSLGNVIDPGELLKKYDREVIRYYLYREIQSTDDSDFSWENMEQRYESDLANGLGNLVQRVIMLLSKMQGTLTYETKMIDTESLSKLLDDSHYHDAIKQFRLHEAISEIWAKIGDVNAYINLHEPWKQEQEEQKRTLLTAMAMIQHVSNLLQPFMPGTSGKIAMLTGIPMGREPADGDLIKVSPGEPLFPRRV